MAAYLIAEVEITDDSWVPDYAAKVHDIAAEYGGKYLARSGNIHQIEGEKRNNTLVAVIAFPDVDSAKKFAACDAYAPFGKARQDGSNSHFYVIDDTDLAGTIPYLGKG